MTAALNAAIAQPPQSLAGTVIGWIFVVWVFGVLAVAVAAGIGDVWRGLRRRRSAAYAAEQYLRRVGCARCAIGDPHGPDCHCPARCASPVCLAGAVR